MHQIIDIINHNANGLSVDLIRDLIMCYIIDQKICRYDFFTICYIRVLGSCVDHDSVAMTSY